MKEFAEKESRKYSFWEIKIIDLSLDNLSDETISFLKEKQAVPWFEKRINFQKQKVKNHKMNTLVITTYNEPIVLSEKKYQIFY
ncbi:MAG: hypothetical protein ACOYLO_00780 [Ferruginibacter sp.]